MLFVRDIVVPSNIRSAMERQAEAERRKRADILQSEGERQREINVSEGKKQAVILQAQVRSSLEPATYEYEMRLQGEAEAVVKRAEATATGEFRFAVTLLVTSIDFATGLKLVSQAIEGTGGRHAVAMMLAEQYVSEFGKLAKETNTIVLPANPGDVSTMVAQALAQFSAIKRSGEYRTNRIVSA